MAQSRREFLKSLVGTPVLLSLSGGVTGVLARAARAAAGDNSRNSVLVVVQLSGGNDGFNTLVPYADDAYARSRSTLRLRAKDVLRVDDHVGFHPRMGGFARLMKEGRLAVVRGVGYEGSHRGHEEAMRDWHTARPGERQHPTGWLGRAVDAACPPGRTATPGAFVGAIAQPFALAAQRAVVPSIRSARELTAEGEIAPPGASDTSAAGANPLVDHVGKTAAAAGDMSRKVRAVLAGTDSAGRHGLAGDLRTVAELIRADVGIRIFLAELGGGGIGGFDNHANQRDNHAALLEQLSEAVAAFADDLARHKCLDRVVLMTFSEFGRTVSENGRRGTDHGAAAPVFLVGGRLRGGLIGKPPSLTDLDQDAPRPTTDFRRLYAAVLDRWLGLDSHAILGARYDPLDLFA